MFQERIPYVDGLQRQATAASTFTARFPKIDSYDYLLVRSISVCNNTNSGIRVDVGISTGENAFHVQTIVMTSDTYFYKLSGTLVVPRGYSIVLRFVSPNDGDMFYANVTGELVSICEDKG